MRSFLFLIILISNIPLIAQNNSVESGGIRRSNPFAAPPDPNALVTYTNPVIPGFYSDPSVCRVGEDYYLVSSTFEYFPGVPVFHSKDLVNWEQIGHCIHRKEQLPRGMGIFAATLRYHDGIFYMITTNVTRPGGNFFVSASKPEGPWSDPVWIDVPGIDPDLFFDDDGRAYVISSPFILFEIDLQTGKLLSEGRKVWNGTGGRYAEGPHIYKKDGFYYLMGAEGGTEEAHSETIARSHSIWGPYTDNPANPILAHANAAGQGNPIQGVGHADMIQAHDGSWWILFHGYRTVAGGVHHLLGRESCLAPVSWPKNAWPVVNGNGTATVDMTCPTLPLKPFPKRPAREDFNSDKPGLEWNYIQVPVSTNYQFDTKQGVLRLRGSAVKIGERESPSFLGRRLQDMSFMATTSIDFNPANENEEAGIILLNNASHFDFVIEKSGGKRFLVVKLQFGSTLYRSEKIRLKPGPVNLKIRGEKSSFSFSYSQGSADFLELEKVDSKFLSSETVGGFTGVYVGLYATGNGKACREAAVFDWFEYEGVH
jgi:xylan 1,4-beta-xylosidase